MRPGGLDEDEIICSAVDCQIKEWFGFILTGPGPCCLDPDQIIAACPRLDVITELNPHEKWIIGSCIRF